MIMIIMIMNNIPLYIIHVIYCMYSIYFIQSSLDRQWRRRSIKRRTLGDFGKVLPLFINFIPELTEVLSVFFCISLCFFVTAQSRFLCHLNHILLYLSSSSVCGNFILNHRLLHLWVLFVETLFSFWAALLPWLFMVFDKLFLCLSIYWNELCFLKKFYC